MATVMMKKGDDYLVRLSRLETNATEVARMALYDGAKVTADAVKSGINSIRVDPRNKNGVPGYVKNDLLASMGITSMENDGRGWNVHIGWDGYGSHPTKKFPRGLPNVMMARAIESGTSFRSKQPFVRPAVLRTRQAALEAMRKRIDEECARIMKK